MKDNSNNDVSGNDVSGNNILNNKEKGKLKLDFLLLKVSINLKYFYSNSFLANFL